MNKLIESAMRVALQVEGCVDVDVALKLADLSGCKVGEGGKVDADSIAATAATFKEAKADLFGSDTSSDRGEHRGVIVSRSGAIVGAAEGSALKMTDAEYEAAKWKMSGEAERRRRASIEPAHSGKSALEMTDEEYNAARRRSAAHPTYAMSGAPVSVEALENRPSAAHPSQLQATGGAALALDRKPGAHHRQPTPTWLGRPTTVMIGPR